MSSRRPSPSWIGDMCGYLHDRTYRRAVHRWLRRFPFEAMWLDYGVPAVAFLAALAVLVFLIIPAMIGAR